jgi:lysophospholipase L1-like esterase
MIRYLTACFLSFSLLCPGSFSQVRQSILTIGDSNGAAENGWPVQLQKLCPGYLILNKSVSGNTIGFDNLGNEKLNTLKNIGSYLSWAYDNLPSGTSLDYIILCVGTNDTKKIFEKRQAEVPENLSKLVLTIKDYAAGKGVKNPAICIVTPPPMDEEKADKMKYGGGDERIRANNRKFRAVAKSCYVDFLDIYTPLKKNFSEKTKDGVHLNAEAQMKVARIIADYIIKKDSKYAY